MAIFDNLGGGAACNMKYDPLTDIQSYKDANGVWIPKKKVGLLWDGTVFYQGNEYKDYTGGIVSYTGHTLTNDGILLISDFEGSPSSTNGQAVYYGTDNSIDLSEYNTLEVTYTYCRGTGSTVDVYFGIVANKLGDYIAKGAIDHGNNTFEGQNIVTLDISDVNEGYIQLGCTHGYYGTTMKYAKIKLLA